jgi:hypothetical protein
LALIFLKQLDAHYVEPIGWRFGPQVAEQTFNDLLQQAHVAVFRGEQIISARKQSIVIQDIECESHHRYATRVFIDSSYEGDLMKAAGVSYTVRREGQEKYGESLAGCQNRSSGSVTTM